MNTPIAFGNDIGEEVVANIICIIDKSGSMSSIRNDTIGSFNTFIEEQKQMPGKATITVVFFNQSMQVWYSGKLEDTPTLTTDNYVPEGMTALYDTVCSTIEEMKNLKSSLLMILTDGEENSSTKYKNKEDVKCMIEERSDNGWTVVYLGANQDAFEEGTSIGISGCLTMNFDANDIGITNVFRGISNTTTSYRSAQYNLTDDGNDGYSSVVRGGRNNCTYDPNILTDEVLTTGGTK